MNSLVNHELWFVMRDWVGYELEPTAFVVGTSINGHSN